MILFKTAAWDVAEGRHPADPSLIGLPFLAWLGPLVAKAGGQLEATPEPNDSGWVQAAVYGGRRFLVGVHAVRDTADPTVGDYSILVQTVATVIEGLTGGADRDVDDDLIHLIERLLIAHGIAEAPTVLIDA